MISEAKQDSRCPTCGSGDRKRLLDSCIDYGTLDPWHVAESPVAPRSVRITTTPPGKTVHFTLGEAESPVAPMLLDLPRKLRRQCNTKLSTLHQSAWYEACNALEKILSAQPPAQTSHPTEEELVIEIARGLYDRFVMGGWEPQDAYPYIVGWIEQVQALPPAEISHPTKEEERREFEKWWLDTGCTLPALGSGIAFGEQTALEAWLARSRKE